MVSFLPGNFARILHNENAEGILLIVIGVIISEAVNISNGFLCSGEKVKNVIIV